MIPIISTLTSRTVVLLLSTTFSILAVMLMLNIITVKDVAAILNLSPEGTAALQAVVGRFQEVAGNITDILSQLLNKLFGWAGMDVDLSKIKVDLNEGGPAGSAAGAGSAPDNNIHDILPPEAPEKPSGSIDNDQWQR